MIRKLLSGIMLSLVLSMNMSVFAFENYDNDIEHIQIHKDSKVDLVKVTPAGNIIQKENHY